MLGNVQIVIEWFVAFGSLLNDELGLTRLLL